MYKLFHHPLSAASRYVRLIIAEYDQQVEFHEEKTWQRRNEFLALNPAGEIPVLIDEARAPVCGAGIIGEYLDETCGAMMRDKRVMPENAFERAETRRIIDWFLVKFQTEVNDYLVFERIFKQLMPSKDGGGSPDAGAIRAGRANLGSHLNYANWLANQNNWLSGKKMTAADLAAASAFSVLDYLGEIDWEKYAGLKDWYSKVKSRPSFRSLLEDKLPSIPPVSHYADLDF